MKDFFELEKLHNDSRGLLTDVIKLVIVGVIVVYVILIFMGAFWTPFKTALDNAVGVEQAGGIELLVGLIAFFVVLAIILKIWDIATGSGSYNSGQ